MARRDTIAPIAAKYGFAEVRRTKHRIWRHASGAQVTTGSTISDTKALLRIEQHFRNAVQRMA